MSRFVTEGGLTKEQFERAQKQEAKEAQDFKEQNDEKERKTLFDQLKENKARVDQEKYLQYRKKYLAHHIDEETKQYYDSVKRKEEEKEEILKKELEEGVKELHRFKSKQKSNTGSLLLPESIKITKQTTKIKKRPLKNKNVSLKEPRQVYKKEPQRMETKSDQPKRSEPTANSLVGDYCSSDSESE